MKVLNINTIIIGTKFDEFEKFDPEGRKWITKILRFFAHKYGSSLLFSSNKNETIKN